MQTHSWKPYAFALATTGAVVYVLCALFDALFPPYGLIAGSRRRAPGRWPAMLASLEGLAEILVDPHPRCRASRRPTRAISIAPSGRRCWCCSPSAPTSATSRPSTSNPVRPRVWARTGRADSSATATARSSTSAGVCSRACRRPTNLVVPPYRFASDTRIVLGEDPVGDNS